MVPDALVVTGTDAVTVWLPGPVKVSNGFALSARAPFQEYETEPAVSRETVTAARTVTGQVWVPVPVSAGAEAPRFARVNATAAVVSAAMVRWQVVEEAAQPGTPQPVSR